MRTGDGEMFQRKTRDEELAAFFGDVLSGEPGFKRRFLAVLSRLDESEWKLLEQMADKLVAEVQKEKADFGRGDYGNTPVDFDLTEEEYEAVLRHIDAGDRFQDCEDLGDLYSRVLSAAGEQIREELEEANAEELELYGEDAELHGDGEDVLAYYNFGVNFEYSD